VVILGAGPAGLAVGAALAARGPDATLLERDRVGSAWHRHYERLHLHTIRARVGDAATTAIARVFIGDLSRHGLPRPSDRLVSRHRARGAVPVLDVGLAGLLKRGRVAIVPAIATLEPGGVVLVDGSRVSADAIVVATGYATGLEALVGGLGVLTSTGAPLVHGAATVPGVPGLHFVGFASPLSGNLRSIALQATAVADVAARTVAAPIR
jgi:putative flavoprotein involved in K+ transport